MGTATSSVSTVSPTLLQLFILSEQEAEASSVTLVENDMTLSLCSFFFPRTAKESMISDKLTYTYCKVKNLSENKKAS